MWVRSNILDEYKCEIIIIMKVTIDIETKTLIRALLVISTFVALTLLLFKLSAALTLIVIAFFLAIALNPPVTFLASKLPGHSRVLATGIAYLFVLSILGFFVYVALPPAIDQTTKFVSELPGYITQLSDKQSFFGDIVNRYNLQSQVNQLADGIRQQSSGLLQGFGNSVVTGVTSVFSGFVTTLTVLMMAFFMLIEGPKWQELLWGMYSNDALLKRHQKLSNKMYKVISGFVNGQAIVASIAAIAAFTLLVIFASFFQSPMTAIIPLTAVVFVTDMIPLIGPGIGAVIVLLVLLISSPLAAFAYLVYFAIYSQIEANVIAPIIQSKNVSLSALSIFVALVVGISLLGLLGGILAIPIAGCIRIIILDFIEHRKHGQKAGKGLFAKLTRADETV
jgi:predicted PurR-regulated permease PerM